MPARLFANHNLLTGLFGATSILVGVVAQEQVAAWIGIATIAWAGLLGLYDRWRASRRNNDRLDLEAKLAELKAERAILEAAVVALKSELSGLQISRNQIACEEGR